MPLSLNPLVKLNEVRTASFAELLIIALEIGLAINLKQASH